MLNTAMTWMAEEERRIRFANSIDSNIIGIGSGIGVVVHHIIDNSNSIGFGSNIIENSNNADPVKDSEKGTIHQKIRKRRRRL
jgi:hypothetical protein